jgi:hypothetical protein
MRTPNSSTRRLACLAAALLSTSVLRAQDAAGESPVVNFVRGDANGDARRDMSDAVYILGFLFSGGAESRCADAADSNDDGKLDMSDAISLLGALFLGNVQIPPPQSCGYDPTDDALACAGYHQCAQPVVTFKVVDGWAVLEEDIVLGRPEDVPTVPGSKGDGGEGGGFAVDTNPTEGFEINGFRLGVRWPGGIIPYRFADGDERRLSDATGQAVMQGIWHWQHRTAIRFVPRTNERDFVTFRKSTGSGCGNSRVGRTGGEQFIQLVEGCGVGTVIHEIGHSVGLWHEQSRNDRDDFIEVLWNNIKVSEWGNFQKRDGLLLGPYDFDSIMHYSAQTGFERANCSGCLSLRTLDLANMSRIGQRGRLSAGDVAAVQQLYGPPRGVRWAEWQRLGAESGRGTQIGVGPNQDGRMEVVVRGTPGDNAWHLWQTAANNGWANDWRFLGGVLASRPLLTLTPAGTLEVVALGTDGAAHHTSQVAPNGGWTEWRSLGGTFVDLVGVAIGGASEVNIFAQDSKSMISMTRFVRGRWSSWAPIVEARSLAAVRDPGGLLRLCGLDESSKVFDIAQFVDVNNFVQLTGSRQVGDSPGFGDGIAAGFNQDGRLEVFVRGTDGNLWHAWELSPRGAWSGWQSLGGPLSSPRIVVARNGDDRLEVFAIGSKDAMLHAWQHFPNGSWSALEPFGLVVKDIAAGANLDGRVEIFAITPSDEIFHRGQDF